MRSDPHSHTDLSQGRTTDVHLHWDLSFADRTLTGHATLRLDEPTAGPLDLDTRGLHIDGVHDADGQALDYTLGDDDPVLGRRLRIERPTPIDTVRITYRTSPDASGLMWLDAAQTASGEPFVLSQCQAIHARSLAPLQDSPRARIRYTASLKLPEGVHAVMSAAPGQTVDGRLQFTMPQPIPPYLLALAAGRLAWRDLGPRTRVYAEPSVVEAAAWEFADVEKMLDAAEGLFGPYAWDRYDAIVLPGSFPLGGMENPRMTFLTPTLLAGDRSLVNVLAHELAHSWTGNLVTNADNEHFWLNEGWTVYAERRIVEALEGAEAAAQATVLARSRLEQVIDERRADGRPTALTYPQAGLHPDDEFSLVPYEKGFLLLLAIERSVGRERFDAFVRRYIDAFAFRTLTTDDFVAFLQTELPDHGVPLDPWLYGEGLPPDAPVAHSERLDTLRRQAAGWPRTTPKPRSTVETLHVLQHLPPLSADEARAVAEHLGLLETGNAELRSAWLALAVRAGCEVDEAVDRFVEEVGRTKLLVPVFRALHATGAHARADALYQRHHARWHGSTRGALRRLSPGR